jgi:hypothetical protein
MGKEEAQKAQEENEKEGRRTLALIPANTTLQWEGFEWKRNICRMHLRKCLKTRERRNSPRALSS